MAIYLWIASAPVPGRVDRIVISFPYTTVHQGRTVPDLRKAFQWAMATLPRSLPFPPSQEWRPSPLNWALDYPPEQEPQLLCYQLAAPVMSAQGVMSGAPVGSPVGQGGMAPPPAVPPRGQRSNGTYEELPDAALPSRQEQMLDIDPTGGTFTDIDQFGNESPRQSVRQAGPRPNQQG